MLALRPAPSLKLLFLLASGAFLGCAGTADRLIDRAEQAGEREAAERVDRGVSGAADAAEEAILKGGQAEADPGAATGAAATDAAEGQESPLQAVREFRSAVLQTSSLRELAKHIHPEESEWRAEVENSEEDAAELQEWQEYFRPYEPAQERIFGDSAVVLAFGEDVPGAMVFVVSRDADEWRIASVPEPDFDLVQGATGSFGIEGAVDASVEGVHARIGEAAAWITLYDTSLHHLAGGFGQIRVPTLTLRYPSCPEVGTHELSQMSYLTPDTDGDGVPEQFAAGPAGEPAVLEIESIAEGRFSGTLRATLQPFQTGFADTIRVTGGLEGIPVHCPGG